MSKGLIVALDTASKETALSWVARFIPYTPYFKIGFELFVAQGPAVVEAVQAKGAKVFLDLKFHDIPNTVAKACQAAARLGVWMINVHASGGEEMIESARRAIDELSLRTPPLLVAVTVLTSKPVTGKTEAQVLEFACLAKKSGANGVVASAYEAAAIREACGNEFVIVTPGIRLAGQDKGDQQRVMGPAEAFQAGSNFLVMGRGITEVPNAEAEIRKILDYLKVPRRKGAKVMSEKKFYKGLDF